jgi:hypothetical protein
MTSQHAFKVYPACVAAYIITIMLFILEKQTEAVNILAKFNEVSCGMYIAIVFISIHHDHENFYSIIIVQKK